MTRGTSPWLAVAAALALGFLLTCGVSQEPVRAYRALLAGPLPDLVHGSEGWRFERLTRLGAVLEDAITLTLLALGLSLSLRARLFALGADGQLFLAALAAAAVGVALPGWAGAALALLAAIAAGALWGALPGVMKLRWGANEIVTSLMLNVIALQFYRWCITHHFHAQGAGFIASPALGPGVAFTSWLPQTNVTAFVLLLVLAPLAAHALVQRSVLGYELRAFGDSPAFARASGIPVGRTVVATLALGGAFAGLAGAHLSHGLLKQLPLELAPGIGFEGLVVALLARLDPRAVPLAALGYAYLDVGALVMERSSDVSREMVLVIQALIVLLAVCQRWWPARSAGAGAAA